MLRLAYFPQKWKHSIIVMIPKPDKIKKDPNNYRPISLLPIFSKIFERLLLPQLLIHLEKTIPETQFGFRSLHSCPQQLHRVVDVILDTFEEKFVCHGLFLDTEKAFDKVWHEGLLYKIKDQLPDTFYRILQSYLTSRTFSVKCENSQSQSIEIESGVPQGSVLGPFLYLMYTSDFPRDDTLTIAQFADDVAILSKGTCDSSANKLQQYANKIEVWNNKWRVKMNPNKSKLVVFTYNLKIYQHTIRLHGMDVPRVDSVKYLGLILDSKLTWQSHINGLVQKIRNRIHQIKYLIQGSSPLPLKLKILIYTTLIRPIWMYACGIWSSASDTQIRRIQTLQNRILRICTDAPWYVRNTTLHNDLQIPEVSTVLTTNYTRLHNSFIHHPSVLLNQIPLQNQVTRNQRRLKRKRHADSLQ